MVDVLAMKNSSHETITANFQKVIDDIKADILTRPKWEQDYLKNRCFDSKQHLESKN